MIIMTLDSTSAMVDEKVVEMDVAPYVSVARQGYPKCRWSRYPGTSLPQRHPGDKGQDPERKNLSGNEHGLAHDVGRLGPALGEKAHVVHGVKQLPVGGLKAE